MNIQYEQLIQYNQCCQKYFFVGLMRDCKKFYTKCFRREGKRVELMWKSVYKNKVK